MEHDNNIITVVYVYAPNSEFYELTSLKIVMYKMKMIKKKKWENSQGNDTKI